jgi:hypothetical protein
MSMTTARSVLHLYSVGNGKQKNGVLLTGLKDVGI